MCFFVELTLRAFRRFKEVAAAAQERFTLNISKKILTLLVGRFFLPLNPF